MLTATKLFDEIARANEPAFWWLGQHSFVIRLAAQTLLIDPFLSAVPGRQVPPLFEPHDAAQVSLVLCTHDHIDHLDPVAVTGLARESTAKFVASPAHRNRLGELGVDSERVILLNDREATEFRGIKVTAVKSAHERFHQTEAGHFPFLGFVIEAEGRTVYHSGDTVWWEGLQNRLSAWKFDVAIVPINGRDASRYAQNIIGNMTYQEAADLLAGLDVKLMVPAHYGMFESNTEDPQLFLDYVRVRYPGRQVWIGAPTECVKF